MMTIHMLKNAKNRGCAVYMIVNEVINGLHVTNHIMLSNQ